MSGEDKNKLDEMFKSKLDHSEDRFDFLDQDWDEMEQLLDTGKKTRGLVYWLPMLSGVAALLLIALGWWYFKPAVVGQKPLVAVHQPKPVQTPGVVANRPDSISGPENSLLTAVAPPVLNHSHAVKSHYEAPVQPQPLGAVPTNNTPANNTISNNTTNAIAAVNAGNNAVKRGMDSVQVTANNSIAVTTDIKELKNDNIPGNADTTSPAPEAKIKKSIQRTGDRRGPQFGLAVMLSPDVNGVNSFQEAKVGTNLGLLFSVSFGKLSVSTGAAYSKKPYMTGFENYHTSYVFKTDPATVSADCRVLDVPLNVDYQVYHKSRNSFSVGSGLSSYIMLKEQYNYAYSQPGVSGPTSFTIVNRNQHILGVLNLNATYIRQLNSKLGIMAQPYYKIPLTNIGYSQVRLRSAGVALGLHWNINQSKTP